MTQATTAAWPDVLALLRQTPRTLRDLTADVSPHILRTRPAPDQWSVSEIISHLCAVEPPYRARLVRITLQENPYVTAIGRITGDYDPDTPVPILIETFTSLRTSTLDFLESLAPVAGAARIRGWGRSRCSQVEALPSTTRNNWPASGHPGRRCIDVLSESALVGLGNRRLHNRAERV